MIMMRLVLGAGLNPRVAKIGPTIRLFAGKYRLVVENHKDSEVVLHSKSGVIKKDEEFSGDGKFYYEILKPGTEEYINIFAEQHSGSDTSTAKS